MPGGFRESDPGITGSGGISGSEDIAGVEDIAVAVEKGHNSFSGGLTCKRYCTIIIIYVSPTQNILRRVASICIQPICGELTV